VLFGGPGQSIRPFWLSGEDRRGRRRGHGCDRFTRSGPVRRSGRQYGRVAADLHVDPDAVEDLARRARRIVDDLGGTVDGGAAAELLAFADAAEHAARRTREADRDAAAGFR